MHIVTGKHLPRRTFVRGMGAAMALPFLDAMVPALKSHRTVPGLERTRLVCIEQVHGAAGCSQWGSEQLLWSPATVGREYDLSPSSLFPLDGYRDTLTILSNTDVRMAEAYTAPEIGGDHFRATAAFLTQAHPKLTEGSDVYVGTSMDQIYAQRFGQDTPIPSMQLCIENQDQAGGCAYGYACTYTDSLSWVSPSEALPAIRDPRVAFERLFGSGATPEDRAARRRMDKSILDWFMAELSDLQRGVGPSDRQRLEQYLDNIREMERRIQQVEARNTSGEPRELPEAPAGVPDSFSEHMQLMFDLQAHAFEADATRVFSFKIGRDGSGRVYPESGTTKSFHNASHHGARGAPVVEFSQINKYHVGQVPYFLDKLKSIQEGDGTLYDKTVVLYGSPMGDGNLHNHRRCPLFLVGGGNGRPGQGLHLRAPEGTPMANVMLSLLHHLGVDDLESFGDSTGEFSFDGPSRPAAAVNSSSR
jgi:hypothetical protein